MKKRAEYKYHFIGAVSKVTLGAYLISYIPDNLIYPLLINREANVIMRMDYFPITVPLVILMSLGLAFVINAITNGVLALVKNITCRID